MTEFSVGSQELAVDVEVQADEENDGDEEGDESQEDELLEKTGLFELDSELVLLLGELVTFAFKKRITNILHSFFYRFINYKLLVVKSLLDYN